MTKIKKSFKTLSTGLIMVVVLDAVGVSLALAFPNQAIGILSAAGEQQKNSGTAIVYKNMNKDNLTAAQKKQVSFKDNSYVDSFDKVTNSVGESNGLFLQGYVSVPNVGIYEPIYYGTSDQVLANGAGTAKDNQTMGIGNYSISAHNMGRWAQTGVTTFSGVRIVAGQHFSPLETKTPTNIYLSDGKKIYTYENVTKFMTNMGDGWVIQDEFPIGNKTLNYPEAYSDDKPTGKTLQSKELNLGNNPTVQQAANTKWTNVAKTVVTNLGKQPIPIEFESNDIYRSLLKPSDFKLSIEAGGTQIPDVSATIKDVKVAGNKVTLNVIPGAGFEKAKTIAGAEIKVVQKQSPSFVTLTTCSLNNLDAQGHAIDRIVSVGVLAKIESVKDAPATEKKLFPTLGKSYVQDVSKTPALNSIIQLSWWQKIVKTVIGSLMRQGQWVANTFNL